MKKKLVSALLALSCLATGAFALTKTAGDYGNPADLQTCSTKKDLPASLLSEEAQLAYDEGLKLVNAQKDAIIDSFGLDLSGFEKFMLTDAEDESAEINKVANSVIPLVGLTAGDSPRQAFLNPEKDLLYVMHQDASEMNHLVTFEYLLQPNGYTTWVKTDEKTTEAYGIKNAEVHETVEMYEAALFGIEVE